jgi:hypothetical protein
MNIITTNPIISETDFYESDWYNAIGDGSRRRRTSRQNTRSMNKSKRQMDKQSRGGGFIQRVNTGVQNLSQSGLLDNISNLGQQNQMGAFNTDPQNDFSQIPPIGSVNTSTGISRGGKIAIGIGVAAILGVGIYFLIKKSKSSK